MQIRAHHIKWGALIVTVAGAVVGLYFLLAYIVLPLTWRHYEHQKALADLPMVTRTGDGIPGDPINVGLVGSREDVLCAMNAASVDSSLAGTAKTTTRLSPLACRSRTRTSSRKSAAPGATLCCGAARKLDIRPPRY